MTTERETLYLHGQMPRCAEHRLPGHVHNEFTRSDGTLDVSSQPTKETP